jgi:CHASE3 domain sensor protein
MAAAILVLATMTWLASRGLGRLHTDSEWVLHSERVRLEIGRVLQLLTDVESSVQAFEDNGNDQFLEPYRAALPQIPTELATLEQLVADNPTQRRAVAQLRALSDMRVAQAQRVAGVAAGGNLAAARALTTSGEGKRTMDEIRGVVAQIII